MGLTSAAIRGLIESACSSPTNVTCYPTKVTGGQSPARLSKVLVHCTEITFHYWTKALIVCDAGHGSENSPLEHPRDSARNVLEDFHRSGGHVRRTQSCQQPRDSWMALWWGKVVTKATLVSSRS